MFVFELVGSEHNPVYQKLALENLDRQYSFLQSVVDASLALGQPMLSIEVIKALNYHAISCLHVSAGEFRPCPVYVGQGETAYSPPAHFQVPAMMQMFTNLVNRSWQENDAVTLATYVLWRLNHIHPFVNGNGRTARVSAYFVLCLRSGGWLPGQKLLPERIVEVRPEYVAALKAADASLQQGELDLSLLHGLVSRLLDEQMKSAEEIVQPSE
ncbi:Fic family protein [Sphingobium limneticum]|uniref:Cell filamentation protein Fic n=1 Tax=Sphingobium limneticum TaxID=1007511 RepID=A0A5J5I751_9SPHN|nr:Fic family protein [Sphingobium limneticum]KAA9019845.1 cell filamentation protein Fic [Sphingobium limneticum]KAA9032303.1 cell filamentation protein Fic [Sphingobium limneticum]